MPSVERYEEYLCIYSDCPSWEPGHGSPSPARLRAHFQNEHRNREIPREPFIASPSSTRYNTGLPQHAHLQARSNCKTCLIIHQAVGVGSHVLYPIGKVADLLIHKCAGHEPFVQEMIPDLAGLGLAEELYIAVSRRYNTRVLVGTLDMISYSQDTANSHGSWVQSRQATIASKKDDWFDLDILRSWLRKCDAQHGDHCHAPQAARRVPNERPLWLIDVQRRCLVSGQPDDEYYALSYVWGRIEMFQTVKSNLEQLRKENGLRPESVSLPRAIQDALHLVALLKGRHLWVDSLCIVQDDETTKAGQINNMASIYANSYATIVVADGKDANHGLRGIEGITKSRDTVSQTEGRHWAQDSYKLVANHHSKLKTSAWWSRGWTLQEFIFSQRAIIFQDELVSWECHCAIWDESMEECQAADKDAMFQRCDERYSNKARGLQFGPWPNLHQYMLLVCAYNARHLTYARDALAAFSGVTNVLSRTFQGGFLCGLPELFFDVALLWQPQKPLKRRMVASSDCVQLPSWSWVGWEGSIDQESWRCGYSYVKEGGRMSDHPTTWRNFPILEWATVSSTNAIQRPLLQASYIDHNRYHHPGEVDLSSSWFFQETVAGNYWEAISGGGGENGHYIHSSDSKTKFRTPIPILDQTEVPTIQSPTFLLRCKPRRGWFKIGPIVRRTIGTYQDCTSVSLQDSRGSWAGVLRLNKQHSSFKGFFLDDDAEGRMCELIAISRGDASNDADESFFLEEWSVTERPKGTSRYEFYNVLWIKWRNGIAYRQALGRILKDTWDKEASEPLEVILG